MAGGLRIGVIGCGFYAQNHLHAWTSLAPEGAVLAAVCDRDPAAAERAGRAFGVPHYTDAAAMLDAERLDLADIVTRHDTHRPLAELSHRPRRRHRRAEALRHHLGGCRRHRRRRGGGRGLARGARELPLRARRCATSGG